MDNNDYDRDYFEGIRQGPYCGYETPYKITALERYLSRIERAFPLREGDSVLDIGCAYGLFLAMCDAKNLVTCGIDVSEHAIAQARQRTRAELTTGNVDQALPYPDCSFALVTAFDIIEHLSAPFLFLGEVMRVLENGGHLVLTTVNSRAAKKFSRPRRWRLDKDPTHNYIFDRFSLRFTLEKAGLEVQDISSPFNSLPTKFWSLFEWTGFGGQLFAIARRPPAD